VPTSSRRVRDPERPERILTSAARLIAQRGYLGVNLSDIGAEAGIVGSGIYRHFDSKAAILGALFDRVVDRLIADAETSLRSFDQQDETLASLVRGQVRFVFDERSLCLVYLQESGYLPEQDTRRLRWKQRHYLDLWRDALAAVRPELSPDRAHALMHATISAIHSVLRYRTHLDEAEQRRFIEEVACSMLGIETLPAESGHDIDPATDSVRRTG
jgi:AcrR family transcriptional regulator